MTGPVWRLGYLLGVALLLALHVGLAVGQIRGHSPANDEPIHIAAGYRMWLTGDSIDQTHPPLAMLALSLPLLVQRADPVVGDPTPDVLERFLFGNRVPVSRMLASTRAVGVATSVGLLLVVFFWSRRLWGPGGALVTLAALALCPLLLADAPIAGNDVACALTSVWAIAAFGRYLQQPDHRRLALFAVAFAAAQATKFSAVLLLPICAALYATKRLLESRGRSPKSAPALPRALGHALLVAVAASFLIWACYGFETASIAEDRGILHPRATAVRAAVARLPGWLRELPVPAYSFIKGFGVQTFHAANQATWTAGYNHQFLFGMNSPDGWWYYFPLAMAVKTPLPFFGLLGWAIFSLRRGRPSASRAAPARDPFDITLLVVPAALWLGFCMLLTINIGIRYLLPIFPLLAILMGALAAVVDRRRAQVALLALLGWQAAGAIWSYPHVHAYFNELAGGPAGGWRTLNNSSIDWGQDLPVLARYLEDNGIAEPYLDYFGPIDPRAWGIRYRPLPADASGTLSGVLVVSQTRLTAQGPHEALYRRLRATPPVAKLGWTLFVYSFTDALAAGP